ARHHAARGAGETDLAVHRLDPVGGEAMAWSVVVRVPRSPEADVVKYGLLLDGGAVGEVLQPPAGNPQYTYSIPTDGQYQLQAVAYAGAGNKSQPSAPLAVTLDQAAPAAPGQLILVSATWVP